MILMSHAYGQDLLLDVLPLIDSKVTYKNVLAVQIEDKLELQHKAQTWFKDANITVLENKPLDDSHHYISAEHSIKALWGPNDFDELKKIVQFKIALTLKKDRFQYVISNFVVKEPNQAVQLEIYQMDHKKLHKYNKAFYERIDAQIKTLISSMEVSLVQ